MIRYQSGDNQSKTSRGTRHGETALYIRARYPTFENSCMMLMKVSLKFALNCDPAVTIIKNYLGTLAQDTLENVLCAASWAYFQCRLFGNPSGLVVFCATLNRYFGLFNCTPDDN